MKLGVNISARYTRFISFLFKVVYLKDDEILQNKFI